TDTPPTPFSTLSLHDALPISGSALASRDIGRPVRSRRLLFSSSYPCLAARKIGRSDWLPRNTASQRPRSPAPRAERRRPDDVARSEEHTSELQSRGHLVCRLL